jgi:calcineurin-like phosphoesterase family protein
MFYNLVLIYHFAQNNLNKMKRTAQQHDCVEKKQITITGYLHWRTLINGEPKMPISETMVTGSSGTR